MQLTLDAVFEDGVLKPLETLNLPEHQRVRITLTPLTQRGSGAGEREIAAWLAVYDGLSVDDVEEVEAIALQRSRLSRSQEAADAGAAQGAHSG